MKPTAVDNRGGILTVENYPLQMGYLPDRFVRKAEEELNEDCETRKTCIKQLREMIENEKSMAGIVVSDDYLLQYLRGRKFNIQKAFHVFRKFVTFARKHKTYFSRIQPEPLEINAAEKALTFLPLRDKSGCAILFIRLRKWNPVDISIDDVIRLVCLLLTSAVSDPMTQVNGFKVIFDFKCNPLKYIRFCTPYYAFLIYHGTQECLPARFKAIHVLNPSLVFKTIWPIISPFLPEKLKKRIHLHESSPRLQNYFPDNLIPIEYGGELKDYDFLPYAKSVSLPECVKYIIGNANGSSLSKN